MSRRDFGLILAVALAAYLSAQLFAFGGGFVAFGPEVRVSISRWARGERECSMPTFAESQSCVEDKEAAYGGATYQRATRSLAVMSACVVDCDKLMYAGPSVGGLIAGVVWVYRAATAT